MKRSYLWVIPALLGLHGYVGGAQDTLSQWTASYAKPETQKTLLQHIFPDLGSSISSAVLDRQEGTYIFPRDNSWVQLSKDTVSGSDAQGSQGYLIVTCLIRRTADQEPRTALSYIFRNTLDRPLVLSGGYASRERVRKIVLPKLGKSFLVVEDSLAAPAGSPPPWTVFLLALTDKGPENERRVVWNSPPKYRNFQMGFADLEGNTPEKLVLRTVSPTGSYAAESEYAAYRWNGERFERDDSVFESRLKELPGSVWQYGTK